jgi:predicted nucleic acid-binding Zn ribbon protein
MRRLALGLAAVLSLAAAGCGSDDPHLARADVAPLIALTNRVAAEGPCAQQRDLAALQVRAKALLNRGAVPPALQEQFSSGVNDLTTRTPACAPPPQPVPVTKPGKHDDHGKGHDKHDHGDKG